jgi:diguanylate cyclase (GGDEF)-like protein
VSYFGYGKFLQRNEAIFGVALCAVLIALFLNFDAFDRFAVFVEQHEAWQLDEVLGAGFVACLGSLILLYRRAREMRGEIVRREAAEKRANDLARHDPLTGLPNRRRFNEELAVALGHVASSANECATFLIDLDQFKAVNDSYGHAVGDALLVKVADRLRSACDRGTLIARLGGDEFAGIIKYPAGGDAPTRVASQIVRAFREPFEVDGAPLTATVTMGVARCPHDATTPSDLLRYADIAMYEGKRAGRGVYRIFHAEMDERLREHAALESELKLAIESGQIKPYFQPVISLGDEHISGFEALARWEHPTRGVIGPDQFISIAEELGIIDLLTYRILRESCEASRDWPPYTTLSINISPYQLKDPWLSARLLAVLAETGFSPARLIVEVTENAIIDDVEKAAEVFASLQNSGVRIALDDFGKGYSSLYHLRHLRFNHLKIDSSFVMSMDSPESEKVVRAITALGKSLGMPVTAEGVETAHSAQVLRGFGCEQAQGFLFGAPVPAADTVKLFSPASAATTGARAGKVA